MNPIARERLAQRRRRLQNIRRRVAAVSAAVFIALFGTIYVQMASGRDPALTATTTTAQVKATATREATPTATPAATATATPAATATATPDPAPVTTSQS